jgi:hypothetical protein
MLSQCERGLAIPSLAAARRIAAVLDTSLDQLLSEPQATGNE